jgi:hypothetical protein
MHADRYLNRSANAIIQQNMPHGPDADMLDALRLLISVNMLPDRNARPVQEVPSMPGLL